MSKRKYLSEFAIGLENSRVIWIPASQISSDNIMSHQQQYEINQCHIYAICKTPYLIFNKEKFEYRDGFVKGEINYKINGKIYSFPFKEEMPLYDGATKVVISDYPHNELITLNDKNEGVRYFPANIFTYSKGLHQDISILRDLELLYIGQSYGDGNRNILDRLKSHSTLQKILASVQNSFPDNEVNILLLKYEPYEVITSMDGRAKAKITDYRDLNRFHDILKNPLTEYQQICLIEAGLIRYFQPQYNKIYKENFPSEKHKILKQCYSLDFSALMLTIETGLIGFSIYTQNTKPLFRHYCNIELTDPSQRYGFFHWYNGDTTMKMPNVITIR